jgi:hypothetical protein
MSEPGRTSVSSAIEALTRSLRSRTVVERERELYRARLARIASRWSRGDFEHLEGISGQRELVLAAVQSISAHSAPLEGLLLSQHVDSAVARALDEADPPDTEPSHPPRLRLVYSRPD